MYLYIWMRREVAPSLPALTLHAARQHRKDSFLDDVHVVKGDMTNQR